MLALTFPYSLLSKNWLCKHPIPLCLPLLSLFFCLGKKAMTQGRQVLVD